MTHQPINFARTPRIIADISDLPDGLIYLFVGMIVVFITLLLIWGMIALMHRIFRSATPQPTAQQPAAQEPTTRQTGVAPATPTAATPPPHEPQATLTPVDDELSPELIAVITAAAVAVLRRPVRIRRVSLVRPTFGSGNAWLIGGRARLMGSHSPTRKPL